MIGRAGALLVDIGIDTVPRGYRIAAGRSCGDPTRGQPARRGHRCARRGLGEGGAARRHAHGRRCRRRGRSRLAAQLELPGGHRAITDSGALRDLAGSLAEGVATHRAELARRLDTTVVVQFDEPSLPAALQGRLTGVTSLTPVHPVDESVATALLDDCVAAVGGEVVLHSCAPELPWKLLCAVLFARYRWTCRRCAAADLDGVGEFVESGRTVMLGAVPSTAPDGQALRRGGRQGSGEHHRPPRIPRARCCATASASPRRVVWPGRRRSGRAPRSDWRRRPPTRSPMIQMRSECSQALTAAMPSDPHLPRMRLRYRSANAPTPGRR